MNDLISHLAFNGLDYITAALQIIGGASLLAAKTKTDKDDRALSWLSYSLNIVAQNWWIKPPKKEYNK